MRGKPRRILLQPHNGSNQKPCLNERFGRILWGGVFSRRMGRRPESYQVAEKASNLKL